ncbi:thioredoxin family protein [Hyphomicrobium sp.]|uniref:thioredoxin family protein n=1 Tax=Hyphomicrobium sp. TaxID=82 RepID=UPI000FB8B630|nr:thioredoxin family protein [Hyphomicrobium sp.]RUP00030.1 MAG: thioredoxin [Hyphomicrobium sp.]
MSLKSLTQIGLAAAIIMSTALGASASERKVFDEKSFAAAQAQGKPVLVDVSASWCPTCQAQKPIIDKVSADPRFKDLTIFEVDFDSRKDVLRKFDARVQSTLIVFKGGKETGRSVGSTSEQAIADLLDKAL